MGAGGAKEIPTHKKTKLIANPPSSLHSPIPHPIYTFDGAEVCLFVKDAPGGVAKAAKAKAVDQKLASAASVSRVLALSKLRQKFEPHEAKRKLAGAYDLFLADARILRSLPKVLGKSFFKSKKQPIPVDLSRKDWAGPVKDAVSATYLFKGGGSCVNIKVGRTSQSAKEIADNVEAVLSGALPHVTKAWAGVASLLLKLAASAALPVYQAVGGGKEAGVEGGGAPVAVEA